MLETFSSREWRPNGGHGEPRVGEDGDGARRVLGSVAPHSQDTGTRRAYGSPPWISRTAKSANQGVCQLPVPTPAPARTSATAPVLRPARPPTRPALAAGARPRARGRGRRGTSGRSRLWCGSSPPRESPPVARPVLRLALRIDRHAPRAGAALLLGPGQAPAMLGAVAPRIMPLPAVVLGQQLDVAVIPGPKRIR